MNQNETIQMRCPKCKREQVANKYSDIDPKDAVILVVSCDECDHGGGFDDSVYYDKDGKEIHAK